MTRCDEMNLSQHVVLVKTDEFPVFISYVIPSLVFINYVELMVKRHALKTVFGPFFFINWQSIILGLVGAGFAFGNRK